MQSAKDCTMTTELTVEKWIAIRKEEGRKIDPSTAEWGWCYAPVSNPYGVYPPDECDYIDGNASPADPAARFGSRFQTCKRRPVPPYRTGRSPNYAFLLGAHARDWLSSSRGQQKDGQGQQGKARTSRDGESADAEKQSKESNSMTRGGARPGAGRKKGKVGEAKRELAAMAKQHAEAALHTLVEIATGDGAASARVSAATAILDRAYGKPTQAVDLGSSDDRPRASHHNQLDRRGVA